MKEVVVLKIGFNPTGSTLPCYKPTHTCNTYREKLQACWLVYPISVALCPYISSPNQINSLDPKFLRLLAGLMNTISLVLAHNLIYFHISRSTVITLLFAQLSGVSLYITSYATENSNRSGLTVKPVADMRLPNDSLRQRVNWTLIISPISEFPGGVASVAHASI